MSGQSFPMLFSPLALRGIELRNRIVSTGHQTWLSSGNQPSDDMIAYHAARARGGAGLIITESARFHESAFSSYPDLHIASDAAIPAYARLAAAVHEHRARVFGQLSHAGRVSRRMHDGMRGVAFAPSAVAENRFHTMPRAMPGEMVEELIAAAGNAARRYAEAGFDGVELLASHGLLFAQFLNPRVNLRTDRFGGSAENRLRFLAESLAAARRLGGSSIVLGIRISVDEIEPGGLTRDEAAAACAALKDAGAIDYVNVTVGSMAGLGGSVHVVPPMEVPTAYVAPQAGALRERVGAPVLVTGRINQPQIAEQVLTAGLADLCGMTRAMIADPDMAEKARSGRLDDIRACIGCNQACIGHFHAGASISCIQHPRTGRERRFPERPPQAAIRRRVLVVGGGPAGMKAAATAAERGHEVTLCEAAARLGGQALLAQLLPDRAEFGGLVTNLERELSASGVAVRLGQRVDRAMVEALAPDAVVLATGALPARPDLELDAQAHVVDGADVLTGKARPGGRVLVADWRCDWTGIGLAGHLARRGHGVCLAVNGTHAGQNLPIYLHNHLIGVLHGLGIEVVPYARLFGADGDTAYLTHIVTGAPILREGIDTVVLAAPPAPDTALETELSGLDVEIRLAGDCLSPRSAEEAVYEGYLAGLSL
ncbi:MAG: FAD-dependent oxidoreductase [Rhodobiaceae bacterium]|nr:FAD-dependent oxidoreductase [Rhodobiaceae bacterium]